MDLGHDTLCALRTAVGLVNSGPATHGEERLTDLDGLWGFVKEHGVSGVDSLADRDLVAVRDLRDRLAEVFTAPDERGAVDRVNAIVAAAHPTPRLTDHDGYHWHVHYFAPDASLVEHLAADCGMALAFVLAAGERDRLRTCAAPSCAQVLVDLSRNRSRRYCDSRTCGNRLHVAAYRARRRVG